MRVFAEVPFDIVGIQILSLEKKKRYTVLT